MKRRLISLGLTILLILSAVLVWVYSGKIWLDHDAVLADAQLRLKAGDLAGAEEILQPLLKRDDASAELLLFAAEINRFEGDFQSALNYCERIDASAVEFYGKALLYRAEANMRLGHFSAASELYEQVLESDPENAAARRQLIFVLNLAGLSRVAVPHMLHLVNQGQFDPELLLTLCDLERPHQNEELMGTAINAFPDDPLVHLAWGRFEQVNREWQAAQDHYRTALEHDPAQIEARLALAEMLLDRQEESMFVQLMKTAPDDAKLNPNYWVILGEWSETLGLKESAVRC